MESAIATATPAATQAPAGYYRPQQPKEPIPPECAGIFDSHPPTDTAAQLLDEQCLLWNADEPTAFGGSGGENDLDWTSLGLDAFGTQLVQPGDFDLDDILGGTQCQSNHSLATAIDLEADLLLLGGGDMTAARIDGPPVNMGTGQDLFSNFTTTGTSPNSLTNTHTPALNPNGHSSTSPASSSNSSHSDKKRSAPASEENNGDDATQKRQRNTMAARRYRQRRLDRTAELEKKLAEMTEERDDLRVKLARREAEVGALREVLSTKK